MKRKAIYYFIAGLLAVAIIITVKNYSQRIPVIKVKDLDKQEIFDLKKWIFFSPPVNITAEKNIAQNYLDVDVLEFFDNSEKNLNYSTFQNGNGYTSENYSNNISHLFNDDFGVAYLLCIIDSKYEQEGILITNHFYLFTKIYLNNTLVEEFKDNDKGNTYVKVKLEKGKNMLLVKTVKVPFKDKNSFKINLISTGLGKKRFTKENKYNYLENGVITNNDTLFLRLDLFKNDTANVTITDLCDSVVLNEYFPVGNRNLIIIKEFRDGVYRCKAEFSNDTLIQEFYCGTINSLLDKYLRIQEKNRNNAKIYNNLSALIERYKMILPYENAKVYNFDIELSIDGVKYNNVLSTKSSAYTLNEGHHIISPEKAKFVKIQYLENNQNIFASVFEIRVYGQNSESDIYLNEIKFDRISTSSGKDTIPNKITDNNYYTAWSPNWNDQWICLELNEENTINEIAIAWKKSHITRSVFEKKIVFLIYELEFIIHNLQHNIEAFQNIPGEHIRGFTSKIDNNPQYYLLHMPDKCIITENKIPLIVAIPHPGRLGEHFLTSIHIADDNRNDYFKNICNEYGIGYLIFDNRLNISNNSSIGTTALFEVLQEVKNDYNINENALFLFGACAAGPLAISTAIRHPDIFAAIGLHAPVINMTHGSSDQSYYNWRVFNHNAAHLNNIVDIPIFIDHSDADWHSSFSDAINFIKLFKDKGSEIQFKHYQGVYAVGYPISKYDTLFSFYKNHIDINKSVNEINFRTDQLKYNKSHWIRINRMVADKLAKIEAEIVNDTIIVKAKNVLEYEILPNFTEYTDLHPKFVSTNEKLLYVPDLLNLKKSVKIKLINKYDLNYFKSETIEGPISHAFANNFVIAYGTRGNKLENITMKNVAEEINEQWKHAYHGDCNIKKDIEISKMDITNSNIILIGNDFTNTLINKISKEIPCKFTDEKSSFKGMEFRKNSMIGFIYPNPMNTDKYIVIIGNSNIENLKLCEEQLFINAGYDYAIWDNNCNILFTGFFNEYWK